MRMRTASLRLLPRQFLESGKFPDHHRTRFIVVNQLEVSARQQEVADRSVPSHDEVINGVFVERLVPARRAMADLDELLDELAAIQVRPPVDEDLLLRVQVIDQIAALCILIEHAAGDTVALDEFHRLDRHRFI